MFAEQLWLKFNIPSMPLCSVKRTQNGLKNANVLEKPPLVTVSKEAN